jgi:hypothetical protein
MTNATNVKKLLERWTDGGWMFEKSHPRYAPPLTNEELKLLQQALKDLQESALRFGSPMDMVWLWTVTHLSSIDSALRARNVN